MIIEFCGLPGSGKSTVALELADELDSMKKPYLLSNGGEINISTLTLIRDAHLIKNGFFFRTIKFLLALFRLYVRVDKQEENRKERYTKKAIRFWFLYIAYEKKDKIVLLDEGMLCAIASLIHVSQIDFEITKDIIFALKDFSNYLIIRFSDDSLTCEKRIKHRKGKCRFDTMEHNKLIMTLRKKSELLDYMYSMVNECNGKLYADIKEKTALMEMIENAKENCQ